MPSLDAVRPAASVELERGRKAFARRAWADAFEALAKADRVDPLAAEDLQLLATAAYIVGREDDMVRCLERAYRLYLDAGSLLRAVRCAFWVGIDLALRGRTAQATGWLGRAQRLLDRHEADCAERGYLLLPVILQHAEQGDHGAAFAVATTAADIAERFGDADLLALAVHEQGRALVGQGSVEEGMRLLDEAMVAVTADELSPIVTGLVYCSVIEGCREVYELNRAHEWTMALARWCERQPDMVPFSGQCLVHRAEIMQLRGEWPGALEEARRARERFERGVNEVAAARAFYEQAEIHRLQGDFEAAEKAYREASRCGWEPQPGLALLRLAQGDTGAAAAAIRRVLGERTDRLGRAGILPAYVEIALTCGDLEAARSACMELEQLSDAYDTAMLRAMVAHARGAVDLAAGDPASALIALRCSLSLWQELQAPYEAARVRVRIGLACRAMGDHDTATLELEAARDAFTRLGAAPELAQFEVVAGRTGSTDGGLTQRELQVLRLVAAGQTNKEIAAQLVLSERTVDRHVSNIFAKLGVSSRTAATAYAYRHKLV